MFTLADEWRLRRQRQILVSMTRDGRNIPFRAGDRFIPPQPSSRIHSERTASHSATAKIMSYEAALDADKWQTCAPACIKLSIPAHASSDHQHDSKQPIWTDTRAAGKKQLTSVYVGVSVGLYLSTLTYRDHWFNGRLRSSVIRPDGPIRRPPYWDDCG